jgi:hypothetical protein
MLSEHFWETRFDRDPSVVGRVLIGEQTRWHVVGVAARVPYLPSMFGTLHPQVFAADSETETADFVLVPFGRLGPGVRLAAASGQLTARLNAVRDAHPRLADVGLDVRSLRSYVYDADRPFHALLAMATGTLLLAGVVNVAILLIATTRRRSGEVGLRLSLGDTPTGLRIRLWTQLSLVALLALPAASIATAVFVSLLEGWVPVDVAGLSLVTHPARFAAHAMVATSTVTLAAGVCVSLAAFRTGQLERRGGRIPLLRASAGGGLLSLVAVQLAVTSGLLIVTGTALRSAVGLATLDTGVAANDLYIFSPRLPLARYPSGATSAREAWFAVLDQVTTRPGITSAALTYEVPMAAQPPWASLRGTEGTDFAETGAMAPISNRYFETMGIRLIEGRIPTEAEDRAGAPVGVLSRSAARLFWGDEPALGRRVQTPWLPQPYEVVGVAEDTRYSPTIATIPTLHVPMWLERGIPMKLVVRSSLPGRDVARVVGEAIREMEPSSVVPPPVTYHDHLQRWRARPEFFARVFAGAAFLTLAVAVTGIAAVMHAVLTLRRRELGIRLALGEPTWSVIGRLLRQIAAAASVGAALGLWFGWSVPLPLEPVPSPSLLPDFVVVAVPLSAVLLVLAATAFLCRRALMENPASLIRSE